MIAYNFHAASNGARGEANGGRWELAGPASGHPPAWSTMERSATLSAEQEIARRLRTYADASSARLLTAVYVSLKTYPCVVLSGSAGVGKAALAQHLAMALVGNAPGQFVRIGPSHWTLRSGQRDYYRTLHTRFGDQQLSEVLHEAQSAQGAGKLYVVLFDGLAPDELFHYLHDQLHLLPVNQDRPLTPPNVLFIVTFHQSANLSERDVQVLSGAPQINVTSYRYRSPRFPLPPVGLQRAMIRDAVHDVVVARDRLRVVFGSPQLPQLSPSPQIVSFLRWYGLTPAVTLDSDMWLFLANSFDRFGNGLFVDDPARNLQLAFDLRIVQRVMTQLNPTQTALRPELSRAVGC
ncbi:hypothetical protein [Chloroflexus sp.]|uniref:hypothetical protein n=1 Tax=Chloroflexus sp. TaxID=1904827 RepID=UPI0026329174|nr:hypothetical protein [uncultured Chloroflexus sp.]